MGKYIFCKRLIAGVLVTAMMPHVAFTETDSMDNEKAITVYKSPTCGCCKKWVHHLTKNGFSVKAIDQDDRNKLNRIKATGGVSPQLASCHTAFIDGYVIEGHVPAKDIERLLKERPRVAGLSVPGMPMGTPGMEGYRKDPFNVVSFTRKGKTGIFSRY